MTFDDQIKRALETLTDRLRDEMSRQVRSTIDELADSARAERDAAVENARVEAERAAGEGLASAVAEAEARGRDSAREEHERHMRERDERECELRQREREEREREERDREERNREERAREAHERAERERETREREAREREEREREERERQPEPELVDARATADAAIGRVAEAFREIDRAHSLTEILETLVSCAGREAARAGVLLVRGSGIHGWRFTGFDSAVEGLPSFDARAEEGSVLAAALRNAEQAGGSAAIGDAPSFARLPPGAEAVAVPITMNGQVVALLYADQGLANSEFGIRNSEFRLPTHTIELFARHGARCLEALTAFKAARALLDQAGTGSAPLEAAGGDEASGDEEASARRYARLIVSEIKLYHEAAVAAGCQERDLATRLGGEIARARVLYEQRVPAHLREQTDYFHVELIRTLANGDASLLEVRT